MKLQYLRAGVAGLVLLASAPAFAKEPSLHVRCDGNPDNVSPGETAARLLGAVTLLGLFAPAPEAADASKRLSGAEGIDACNRIVATEKSDLRWAQLLLANALHHIEAGDLAGARQQLQTLKTGRPLFTGTQSYRITLGVSAAEVEALTYLHEDQSDKAAEIMLAAAAEVPYDLMTQLNAARMVQLSGRYGEAEQRFYGNLVRVYPLGMMSRIDARQMAGDFAGAADDLEAITALMGTISKRKLPLLTANLAVTRGLAGDFAAAAEAARRARAELEGDDVQADAAAAGELLDLHNILVMHKDGRAREARLLFAGRSNWTRPSAGAVAQVARVLREGAPAEELIGALARDPETIRRERIARWERQARLTGFEGEAGAVDASLDPLAQEAGESSDKVTEARRRSDREFRFLRTYWTDKQFAAPARGVWRAEKNHYVSRDVNKDLGGRFVNVAKDAHGTPGGYAFLLHSALKAEAEGKSAFMLLPGQRNTSFHMVRFGNPGDEGLIEPFTFNAKDVIQALSPIVPKPLPRR